MKTKAPEMLTLKGRPYVLVPQRDYERLTGEPLEPAMPQLDAQGNYPALEAMRVLLARDIIRDRRKLGLNQRELAKRAGIRVETLCRIETGKHTPSVPVIDKIDRALKAAEADQGKRTRKRVE
ncbi:MAG: helix-turn-helix transcriptional regulator [Planctomycetes bacterium]|nr:helix-turn-helix transcriptional regulator [Planctomycetota bacterium]